jgi:hypothetical protein
MTFRVMGKEIENSSITYTIIDTTNGTKVGTATIRFHLHKSFWKYTGTDGLLINDDDIRRKMDQAIRRHNSNIMKGR